MFVGIIILHYVDRVTYISYEPPSLPNVLLSVYGICLAFLLPKHQSVEKKIRRDIVVNAGAGRRLHILDV